MISLYIFLTFLLIALAILFRTRKNFNLKTEAGKWLVKPILILVVGIIVSLVNPFNLERVDAGHIGLKVNLTGDERGVSDYVYKTGWVVFNSWTEKLYEFPTFQQHIDYNVQTVITKGGFSADIRPSFNYALVSTTVGDMFQNLRLPIKEVEQGWLKTAIVGSVNDVANKWAVDSIFNHRELFESSIIIECNKRISKWFTVSQLRTNITPPPALQSAIEAKTKALQDVQVADNQKQVAVAEALRKIAIARGDSAQMVIEASGEAEAIKRKQLTLSNMYIEYLKIQKWDGKNPTTVLGKEGSTIISVK
ncbi:MAG: SPFH domain-containing protein [Bacteroidota bacterium]|nr:SPFH domain-containing protein [Bacteroidota bacterium]